MSAEQTTAKPVEDHDDRSVLRQIAESSGLVVALAVVASIVIGAILVVLASPEVEEALGYFFSRPADTFAAAWEAITGAYTAMFRGSVWNYNGDTFVQQFRPLTESLTMATPLIFAGLGLGIGFRAGLFNIGAQGQIIMGAMLGGWVGFAWNLPWGLHLLVAICASILGGAIWGFIPGILKAKTGAHEVIVTIMLNYVAANLIAYALSTDAFQIEGSDNPKSPAIAETAQYPLILGDSFRLNLSFLFAIAAAFGVWWLMERSTWGFRFRAVGANARAARTAGMNVPLSIIGVMTVAGALSGLAGSSQILGTESSGLTAGVAGSFGFDAITVALLGRSRPLGTVMAAILFGGFKASGPALQVQAGLPVDIVLVIQSLIVLFIAAPPLVRFLFRLPAPSREKVVAA